MKRSSSSGNAPTGGRTAVAALFSEGAAAEAAVMDLRESGVDRSDIGIALRDRNAHGRLIEETETRAGAGAATGAVGGGLLGGLAGWLIGVGALIIPGIGPVVAGGAVAAAFGTAAAGAGVGAAAGGLAGALIGMGIPEEEARYYEGEVRSGGIVVTVISDDPASAREILREHGGRTPEAETSRDEGAPGPIAGRERLSARDKATGKDQDPPGGNMPGTFGAKPFRRT